MLEALNLQMEVLSRSNPVPMITLGDGAGDTVSAKNSSYDTIALGKVPVTR